jgi:hypothetical protein
MPLPITLGALSARGFGLFSAPAALAADPYFEYVTMLLHGDGTNGAQNNTFLDSSTNNFTITRNGNTTQGSFSPYGVNWSNYFDAYTKYLSVNAQTALSFGTGDFTIEAWVYVTSISTYAGVIDTRSSATSEPYVFGIYNTSGNRLDFVYSGARVTSASTLNLNSWNHVAVSRSGTTVRLFINGVLDANTATVSSNINATSATQYIGAIIDGSGYNLNGYISNLRVVKGTAVYTSSFTPSTTPLTAISGTSLLTCQSSRFVDNSSNNFAITVVSTPTVQRFSPFSPTAAYSTSTIGGSGYFDGSGDYLSAPNNTANQLGAGDFTIEFFAYFNSVVSSGVATLLGKRVNSSGFSDFLFATVNGVMGFYASSNTSSWNLSSGSNMGNPTTGQWYHYVAVRSGSSVSVYVNGVRTASGNFSTTSLTNSTSPVYIGADSDGSYFTGYIEDVRIVKGTALYNPSNTTLTVPTAPLTAITNTSLLLNYTNGGIFDNAMMNNLETVGNAQISTSVFKYGTGSLAFDGTGDWLVMPSSPNFTLGTGDFTIEGWANITSLGSVSARGVFQQGTSSFPASVSNTVALGVNPSGTWAIYAKNTNTNSAATLSTGTWAHFAVVRSGTTTTLYANGTSVITVTADSTNYTGTFFGIGSIYGTSDTSWHGYIDDLRITKGYARYTSNFTPPTAAFPNN